MNPSTEGPRHPRRVLVGQSYFLAKDPKLRRAGQPVPPLGALICAALLRARGFEVRVFDAMLAQSEEECGEAMDRFRPDVLVLFEDNFNYLSKMSLDRMRRAAVRLIALARERGIEAAVAGSDATEEPLIYLRAGAAVVARGEAELSIAEWLEMKPGSKTPVEGLSRLDALGSLESGPPRPPMQDLDQLPQPAWDLIDIEAYRRIWMSGHRSFSLPLATSRGCPYHCNWCAKPIWGQRYHVMSPARAALEVETLRTLGATAVNVVDDIFGLKPGWMTAFAEELAGRGSVMPFKCLSRADLLDESAVHALRRAGCAMVWIGAESGSQNVLDAMEKGTTVDEIRSAAAKLRASGIKVGFFLQFGYPGETAEDIEATVALVEEVLPDDIGISVSYPLPGTPFHARVRQEMESTRWQDSSDLAMLFHGLHATAYYRRLHTYTHARFRLARALRASDQSPSRRALRVLRYGVTRGVMSLALAVIARRRAQAPRQARRPQAGPAES